jgi:hypothetical protein
MEQEDLRSDDEEEDLRSNDEEEEAPMLVEEIQIVEQRDKR